MPCELLTACALMLGGEPLAAEAAGSSPQKPTSEIVKPSAWATREMRCRNNFPFFYEITPSFLPRYRAELTEIRTTMERQREELKVLAAEADALRSGQAMSELQRRNKELEQQVSLAHVSRVVRLFTPPLQVESLLHTKTVSQQPEDAGSFSFSSVVDDPSAGGASSSPAAALASSASGRISSATTHSGAALASSALHRRQQQLQLKHQGGTTADSNDSVFQDDDSFFDPAAAADAAAIASGRVVVEHLSVSRAKDVFQQRVDAASSSPHPPSAVSLGGQVPSSRSKGKQGRVTTESVIGGVISSEFLTRDDDRGMGAPSSGGQGGGGKEAEHLRLRVAALEAQLREVKEIAERDAAVASVAAAAVSAVVNAERQEQMSTAAESQAKAEAAVAAAIERESLAVASLAAAAAREERALAAEAQAAVALAAAAQREEQAAAIAAAASEKEAAAAAALAAAAEREERAAAAAASALEREPSTIAAATAAMQSAARERLQVTSAAFERSVEASAGAQPADRKEEKVAAGLAVLDRLERLERQLEQEQEADDDEGGRPCEVVSIPRHLGDQLGFRLPDAVETLSDDEAAALDGGPTDVRVVESAQSETEEVFAMEQDRIADADDSDGASEDDVAAAMRALVAAQADRAPSPSPRDSIPHPRVQSGAPPVLSLGASEAVAIPPSPSAAASQPSSKEVALEADLRALVGKLSVYEVTLEQLRSTVEEADMQKQVTLALVWRELVVYPHPLPPPLSCFRIRTSSWQPGSRRCRPSSRTRCRAPRRWARAWGRGSRGTGSSPLLHRAQIRNQGREGRADDAKFISFDFSFRLCNGEIVRMKTNLLLTF